MVLIVDDQKDILVLIKEAFKGYGIEADIATCYADCEQLGYFSKKYEAIVTDGRLLNNESGLDIIKEYKRLHPEVVAVRHSAYDMDKKAGLGFVDLTVDKGWGSIENLVSAVILSINTKAAQKVINVIYASMRDLTKKYDTLSHRVDCAESTNNKILAELVGIRKDNKNAMTKVIFSIGGVIAVLAGLFEVMARVLNHIKL